ncbi:MFS transporter [Amycolatopsis australiensis]|uniref:Major Facilitator Superfamily protein n=1 Tax=Amycolatopsis australiensis TaxID=546364 RepID=A0A1K1SLG8_9PSEU|nr:MFS transporter [Amycolatopsis australiensis]SFW85036.1 Major Facilitator Superfamily protein [Amycolatopsis australiensis]
MTGRTLVIIALGAFVTTLDNTIVAAGAPSIAADFGLGLGALQWVALGYMLPFAGLLPVAGRLVDRWGRRPTLSAGLLAFGAGAAAGGVAGSAGLLVAARVLQGTAAAFLVPGLLSLLRSNLGTRGRTLGAAVWTASLAAALALGPALGGLLSEYLGWGWIFFANLPFVAVMLVLLPSTVPRVRDPDGPRPPVASMAVVTASLVLLTAALAELGDHLRAGIALLAAGSALGGWFVLRERRAPARLVPAALTGNRVFTGSLAVQVLWGLGISGIVFFTPLLHQEFLGLGPVRAGLPLAAVAVAVAAAAPLVPRAVTAFGPHRTVAAGLAVVAAGLGALAVVNHVPALGPRLPALVLIGAGSAFTTPSTSHALDVVAQRHSGTASGLLTASRELASALGVALIGAVLTAVRAVRLGSGAPAGEALADGYTAGLLAAAAATLAGALLALRVSRVIPPRSRRRVTNTRCRNSFAREHAESPD